MQIMLKLLIYVGGVCHSSASRSTGADHSLISRCRRSPIQCAVAYQPVKYIL